LVPRKQAVHREYTMKWLNDIMISDVFTVEKGTPIMDVVAKLVKHNVTGFPVVNDKDEVIGIISEKDILALAIQVQQGTCSAGGEGMLVEDFMTKDVVTIEATESMTSLCSCLMKNKFRRLPVLLSGKLVGIATRKDVISHIFDIHTHARTRGITVPVSS
jgi:CBS domain-containing protein